MIKINFIGQKNSGKSLSCFMIATASSLKNKKTLIINFDKFSKYNKFIEKNERKHYKKKKILSNNLHVIDFDFNKLNDNNMDNLINEFINNESKNYEYIFIDQPISFSRLNLILLKNSNFCIIPFKLDDNILDFHNGLIDFIKDNELKINIKYLPILSKEPMVNLNNLPKLRKQMIGMLFQKTIPNYDFDKYEDLLTNKKLFDDYNEIFENIINNYLNIE